MQDVKQDIFTMPLRSGFFRGYQPPGVTGLDDLELVAKSRTGDLNAFEELVHRYENKIFNFIYRFIGNWADASDLSQETFIRVYKSLSGFRQNSSFAAWLYRIAANICRDELRKKRRQSKISLDEIAASSEISFTEKGLDCPEKSLEQRERQEMIQKCLNNLPHDYRLVLVMREMQNLSYNEIAEALDCSIGTVKSRLSRARLSFKQKIIAERELFDLPLRHEGNGG